MSKSILYIEDEEDYQILVSRIVRRAGYALRVAGTGEEGLAMLRAEQPSLLLLDINLPDTDGYSICKQLRKEGAYKNLPILMLTVRRRPEEWLQGFSCGANDYLSKPFDPAGLLERVRSGLEGKTLQFVQQGTPEYLLIQAAVGGNRAAFEVLIQKYRERLTESVRQLGRNSAEAEDIVAIAFVRAFEGLKEFRGEAAFYTWLYRIAANEASAVRRADVSIDELFLSDDSMLPKGLSEGNSAHQALIEKEDSAHVQALLEKIPQPYRQMLDLYFLKDLSYEDISRKLRIPMGTVMSRLFKARELLKNASDGLATSH